MARRKKPDIVVDHPENMMYPTNVGAPNFKPVPIKKEKDHMINMARMNAKQEYDRIMELVAVLKKQADNIKTRLDLTDLIYQAKYSFKIVHGKKYWLVKNTKKNWFELTPMGPEDWLGLAPDHLTYIKPVKSLGDYTWEIIEDE